VLGGTPTVAGLAPGSTIVADFAGGPGPSGAGPGAHAVVSPGAMPVGGDRPASTFILPGVDGAQGRWEPTDPENSVPRARERAAVALRDVGILSAALRRAAEKAIIAPYRGFQLMAEAFPFARGSLEQAIGRLRWRSDELASDRTPGPESPWRWIPWLVPAIAAAASELAHRRRRPADEDDDGTALGPLSRMGWHGLPGVPGPR
jgi:hypothetical protein